MPCSKEGFCCQWGSDRAIFQHAIMTDTTAGSLNLTLNEDPLFCAFSGTWAGGAIKVQEAEPLRLGPLRWLNGSDSL